MIFTGSDALKKVNSPFEYRYMRVWQFTLRLLGGWPDRLLEKTKRKYHNGVTYSLLFVKILTAFGGSMYLIKYGSSLPFMEIGHNYITLFMTFVTISRLSTLFINTRYHELIKRFLTEFHLYYYKDESEYALLTHVKVHKKSAFYCYNLNILVVIGTILFNFLPIYANYRNGKFDVTNPNNISFMHAIYYYLPFDANTNMNGYIAVSIFNWYSTYICTTAFCMGDLIVFILVFHLRGHFKILLYKLANFPLPSTHESSAQLYKHSEMIEIEKKLKHCIDYHRKLITITNEMSSVFGPMLFVYYTFHQITDCLILLEISQMNLTAFVRYGPLTLALFQQLIQLSVIIESIGTVTEKLKDAVYCLPWEYMDTKNRKLLLIFMMNVAKPVHVNALGLTKVGVTSMATILKTTFTYFAFLRSIAD